MNKICYLNVNKSPIFRSPHFVLPSVHSKKHIMLHNNCARITARWSLAHKNIR